MARISCLIGSIFTKIYLTSVVNKESPIAYSTNTDGGWYSIPNLKIIKNPRCRYVGIQKFTPDSRYPFPSRR